MKAYSKPNIVKVGNPLYAKHGATGQVYPFVREEIEGIPVSKLVKKFGSPLFVFSETVMREKYRQTFQSIKARYPNVLNTGVYPVWSRFGFNLENGQAWAAVRRILKSRKLRVGGVHCHIGTFILDPTAYSKAARKLSEFIKNIENISGEKIQFLDLGGGFASLSHLKGIYQPPEVAVPSVEDYAEAIGKELSWLASRRPAPTLFMELGRHLVDEAGFLITQVVGDKLLPDGRRSYVIDAGVNLLYTSTWYKFRVDLDHEVKGLMTPSVLNGPLCMNIDTVDEAILLPRLKRHQNLILSPVGAYNVTQWMQFIQYRPAIVLITEKGKVEVLRRAERLEDLNQLESA
ncbi:MAG: hypothetical protein HYX41_00625 [Bdellovibrio sp.]|nr:hypothetical protein [Bdellovibrio sp.]